MKNPFVSTDMVWDSDVNPEGAFANYAFAARGCWKPFVTAGAFLVAENADSHDANMLAAQAGWDVAVSKRLTWTLAATYYDWLNFEEPGNFYKARGNTVSDGFLTADDFDVVNVTNFLATEACGRPLRLFADFAQNVGDDSPPADAGQDTAWGVGAVYGQAKEKGDWQFDYAYKRIEANAVPASFADSTFGYTNVKGHAAGVTRMLHRSIAVRAAAFFTQAVRGDGPDATTVQADLLLRF